MAIREWPKKTKARVLMKKIARANCTAILSVTVFSKVCFEIRIGEGLETILNVTYLIFKPFKATTFSLILRHLQVTLDKSICHMNK